MMFCSLSISMIKNVSQSINFSVMSALGGDFDRPRVNVQINNVTMSWLYDTGAAKSCISTAQFYTLYPNGCLDFIHKNYSHSKGLQDAGGHSLNLYGIVPLTLTILGKTITHNVWICDSLRDSIIGVDLINEFQLQ